MKTVFINGSPKKKMSVSSYLLFLLRLAVKGEVVQEQVRNQSDHARVLESLRGAERVVFGLPLYVDGVPSHVLAFMKEMETFCREQNIHLRVYVLANCGFIEGKQSKPMMQVFQCFCERCGHRWCGGVGIGGGVMVNVLRILLFVYLGMFAVNVLAAGLPEALNIFSQQLGLILFFQLGVLFEGARLGLAMRADRACGVHYTRVLLPSFLFILSADVFFIIISLFEGGIFKGWLARK